MANIIENLFQWAGAQPADYKTTVRIAITSNEITRNNRVGYAEGILRYHAPRDADWFTLAPFFQSDDGVKQYFSNNRYPVTSSPFDDAATGPLTVSIRTDTTITLISSKFGIAESFTPSFDAASGVFYASVLGQLLTVSLCNQSSEPDPNKPPMP